MRKVFRADVHEPKQALRSCVLHLYWYVAGSHILQIELTPDSTFSRVQGAEAKLHPE